MGRGSLEVSVYNPPLRSAAPVAFPREERSRKVLPLSSGSRIAGPVAAALFTFLLHGVLVTSIFWGVGSPARRFRDVGALDAVVSEAAEDGALEVIFVQDPSSAPAAAAVNIAVSASKAIVAIPFSDALSETEASLPDISAGAVSSASASEPDATRSAMYGRYVGQIDARIERAWRRPRTDIGADVFACIVRIEQDSDGTVQEVTLEQCNGDKRWQSSLVSAIETASPLPAPPDPKIFTHILHMSFQAQGYSASVPQDGYEPPSLEARTGVAERDHAQRSP